MRSSRRTTPQVAENSVVDNATDACSLRRIFATFLAVSSASLGRPYFYLVLIQSNGWKAFAYSPNCQSRIIAMYSFKVSLSESGITKTIPGQLRWIGINGIYFLGWFQLQGDIYGKGGVLN